MDMNNPNTFGVHFTIRKNRPLNGKYPIYARITVNGKRSEIGLKTYIHPNDWNSAKGLAKPKSNENKSLNIDLEIIRSKLTNHYRNLEKEESVITAETVKNAYLGINKIQERQKTLKELLDLHDKQIVHSLEPGTTKNYKATSKYLHAFLEKTYRSGDVYIKDLDYGFINSFSQFVLTTPIKEGDPCTQNGMMKHMERLKRMVNWAHKMGWIPNHPFIQFQLKFKKSQRQFLTEEELNLLENFQFNNFSLELVCDLFVFSCYTGLAYCDLMDLSPEHIGRDIKGKSFIYTSRLKTDVDVNIPLLKQPISLLGKYKKHPGANTREKCFPFLTNQEVNRSLKIIAEIVGIKKNLTFHIARHTFATLLIMNGVPIETVKALMGHTKITTTMIYTHIANVKVHSDMDKFESKLKSKRRPAKEKLAVTV